MYENTNCLVFINSVNFINDILYYMWTSNNKRYPMKPENKRTGSHSFHVKLLSYFSETPFCLFYILFEWYLSFEIYKQNLLHMMETEEST